MAAETEKKAKAKKKPQPWIRPRHKVVRNILYYTLGTYCRLRYNAKVEKFKEWEAYSSFSRMNSSERPLWRATSVMSWLS